MQSRHLIQTLAAALALGATTHAYAADTECRGTYGAVTLVGNVLVPDDSSCTLLGTTVEGAVVVKSRASLNADGVSISNGIQGESPARVVLTQSEIGNSVSLRKGGEVRVESSMVNGDIQLEENVGPIAISSNGVVGSVQANKNRGGLSLWSNTIGNGLSCQDNTPPPTGGNNIAKQKQGQCLNL